jgi:hypothetical protein
MQAGNHVFPYLGDAVAILSALALWATMGIYEYGGMRTVLTSVAYLIVARSMNLSRERHVLERRGGMDDPFHTMPGVDTEQPLAAELPGVDEADR